ncbi:HNH endonuclease [Spirosoma flavum]|uniref:HNH endonuclease n=1 Tax=Spirosoma flavum TaxID=2048557 RepID=A0ABW6ANG3_9BACT
MLPVDLQFESRDTEIFVIPDTKTKLNTIQNYFFPRLQKLLDSALIEIKTAYKLDPFDRYSYIYSPSHRKEAKTNRDTDIVLIGLCGRRDINRQLALKRPDGKPYAFYPATAVFEVTSGGQMSAYVNPFNHTDDKYSWKLKRYLRDHLDSFSALLNAGGISYISQTNQQLLQPLKDLLKNNDHFFIRSSVHYLPITNPLAIEQLIVAYVFLFPLLDLCSCLAEGIKPNFPQQVHLLSEWLTNRQELTFTQPDKENFILPELDSYQFVRAGLWYQVLARDQWTCLSCRRSTKEHSIILHVDHILPRSKGGKDELSNLQTLCLKCNIGKSNRDDTDLR